MLTEFEILFKNGITTSLQFLHIINSVLIYQTSLFGN